MVSIRRALLHLTAVTGLMLAACSGHKQKQEEPEEVNLRKIGQAYVVFCSVKSRPPHDESELKSYFPEIGETGDPDEILRSPRDGQPYVIIYGVPIDSDARSTVLAHEKDGAGGVRYVLTQANFVKTMTDQEFASATFAVGKEPKKRKK